MEHCARGFPSCCRLIASDDAHGLTSLDFDVDEKNPSRVLQLCEEAAEFGRKVALGSTKALPIDDAARNVVEAKLRMKNQLRNLPMLAKVKAVETNEQCDENEWK